MMRSGNTSLSNSDIFYCEISLVLHAIVVKMPFSVLSAISFKDLRVENEFSDFQKVKLLAMAAFISVA